MAVVKCRSKIITKKGDSLDDELSLWKLLYYQFTKLGDRSRDKLCNNEILVVMND